MKTKKKTEKKSRNAQACQHFQAIEFNKDFQLVRKSMYLSEYGNRDQVQYAGTKARYVGAKAIQVCRHKGQLCRHKGQLCSISHRHPNIDLPMFF